MKELINSNFTKILVAIAVFITLGVSVFSMAAMQHTETGANCMVAMNHSSGCSDPVESQSCLNFHLGLMEKFSQNLQNNFGIFYLFALLALVVLFVAVEGLKFSLNKFYRDFRIRCRQLYEQVASVFQETLGFWLSIFEKRDPAHAFVLA